MIVLERRIGNVAVVVENTLETPSLLQIVREGKFERVESAGILTLRHISFKGLEADKEISFFTFIETVKTEAVLTIVTPRKEWTTILFYVTKQYTYELIDA